MSPEDIQAQAEAIRLYLELYTEHQATARRNLQGPLCHIVWLLGVFPLPVVNYGLLWRRHWPADLRGTLRVLSFRLAVLSRVLFRVFVFVFTSMFWTQHVLFAIARCGNMVTFSKNFYGDIVTYMLRNYPMYVQRQAEIVGESQENINYTPQFASVWQFIRDTLALTIKVKCNVAADGTKVCEPATDSLIFKLSAIISQGFLAETPSILLTTLTVSLYLLWVVGAELLTVNVAVSLFYHFGWRWKTPINILIKSVKAVFTHPSPNVC